MALVKCLALEEYRNLISTFSETGFSGCANINALQAMQLRSSMVQQKTPQNPKANASNFALILYGQSALLCPEFPQALTRRRVGRCSSWWVSEPLLRMAVSWWCYHHGGTPWCPTQGVVYREVFWDVSPQNLNEGKI